MDTPTAVSDKRFWIAAGLALLLVILLIAALAQTKLPDSAQSQSAAQPAATPAPLHLSPADAARRAAIAKLGPIDSRLHGNAAELYARAMALYNRLTDQEKQALQNWHTKMDPAAAAALSAKIQPIIQLFRDARSAADFDWGPNPLANTVRRPRLEAMQDLTSVATWEANYRFQSDPDGALQVLHAAELLDENAGQTLGGFGTYSDLRQNIAEVIAANANALSNGQFADLNFLTNPTYAIEASQNILSGQSAEVQSLIDQYNDPATHDQAAQTIHDDIIPFLVGGNNMSIPTALNVMKWIAQTDQQFATTIAEPDAQFQQWLGQVRTSTAGLPIGQSALATILDQRGYLQTFETEDDMMYAANTVFAPGNQPQNMMSITNGGPTYSITPLPQGGYQLSTNITTATGSRRIELNFGTGQ